MLKYTKILCAFEFDDNSIAALHLAATLAKESNATLYILHITKVPNQDMDVPVPIDKNPRWERDARTKLARVAKKELAADIRIKLEVASGLPSVDIVRLANELDVDLIVMATHGRSGLMHFMMGSVTEEVIKEATCPVLVIRPSAETQKARSETVTA